MAQPNKLMIDKDLLAVARAALADHRAFIQSLNSPPRSPRNGRHWTATSQAHRDPAPTSSAGFDPGSQDRTVIYTALYNTIAPWQLAILHSFDDPTPQPIPHAGIRAGEIVGYRAWWVVRREVTHDVDVLRLRSLAHEHIWTPGAIEQGDTEKVVHTYFGMSFDPKHIYGGVYSFKTAELDDGLQERIMMARQDYLPTIAIAGLAIGTIFCWGDVVEHETGWRASHAKLRSLDEVIGVDAEELRKEYGV